MGASTTREQMLTVLLAAFILVAGGGFVGYQFLYVPIRDRDRLLTTLMEEVQQREDRVAQIKADLPKLATWRKQSLPPDVDLAHREYERELNTLLRLSEMPVGYQVTPKPPDSKSSPVLTAKKPIYTRLTYNVRARADIMHLVDFLDRFYRVKLLHQIRNFSVKRPITGTTTGRGTANELELDLTIEAIVLDSAEPRPALLWNDWAPVDVSLTALLDKPTEANRDKFATALKKKIEEAKDRERASLASRALIAEPKSVAAKLDVQAAVDALKRNVAGRPVELATRLAEPARDYASIGGKNIFYGMPPAPERSPPPEDLRSFVRLTDITHSEAGLTATLYDRAQNYYYEIRETDDGGLSVYAYYVLNDRRRTLARCRETFPLVQENGFPRKIFTVVDLDENELTLKASDELQMVQRATMMVGGGAGLATRAYGAFVNPSRRGDILYKLRVGDNLYEATTLRR